MDPKAIVAGMQKWRWLAAVSAPLILLVCCVATRAPDEREAVERAFRGLPEVLDVFGEVYTMSSTMKPARVQWTGQVKSGYFVYDVRGRSLRTDVMIHWEKPAGDGTVTITKVSSAGGRLIYAKKELPNQRPDGTSAKAPPSNPSQGAAVPHP